MAPLEPWEKVLVSTAFTDSTHGRMSCASCHGGVEAAEDMEAAHEGMLADPSAGADSNCAMCHAETAAASANSLHTTQAGYWTVINARSTPENHPVLETMFGNHCASCHTSCGDCHISQPGSVGGGLFNGHLFEKTPPMTRSCTACHGSRVGNEYLGKNEGIPGDVHFREARMNCVKCHTANDLHGVAPEGVDAAMIDHRYAGPQSPRCEDCHDLGSPVENAKANEMHGVHGETLSCQVCHSVTYTSCDGCHVAISEKSGNPFFATDATYFTFLIGRNPRQDDYRPYEFVPLRHIPVATTSYEYYGANLLPNFDALPTWAYATPHNIQKSTPQTASCDSCHGNAAIFLTADKVAEGEQAANQAVIVNEVPPVYGAGASLSAAHSAWLTMCLSCHEEGSDSIPKIPENHVGWQQNTCQACHKLP